jgi:hypothetical protein
MIRRGLIVAVFAVLPGLPAQAAGECDSLIKSMCEAAARPPETPQAQPAAEAVAEPQPTRWLKVERTTPVMKVGDRFPVENHSLIMDPKRYGLPAVDGNWRYYEKDGTVYRVASDTAEVLEVVKGAKVWLIN